MTLTKIDRSSHNPQIRVIWMDNQIRLELNVCCQNKIVVSSPPHIFLHTLVYILYRVGTRMPNYYWENNHKVISCASQHVTINHDIISELNPPYLSDLKLESTLCQSIPCLGTVHQRLGVIRGFINQLYSVVEGYDQVFTRGESMRV